jgi:2-polyprenyl-6-methoxyphenol hydroxylase-like FAD-dependent oxidoreductase
VAGRALRVAIAGGGIGGLTAALALLRAGLSVQVYEQADRFSEVGAGVTLGPNAVRLLQRLGLGARLDEISAHPQGYEMRRWHDGRVLIETHRSGPLRAMKSLTMHRADLHNVLLDAIPPEFLHAGRECTGVDQHDEQVLARFHGGGAEPADVVVGADGIHSAVRSMFSRDAPVFSGTIAYRGLIPVSRLPFLGVERDILTFWLGPRQHLLTFPVAGGAVLNLVAFVPADGSWAEESWTAPGEVSDLIQHFSGWAPPVPEILRALDGTMRWAVYDREPLRSWGAGRVTLLGDAAHAMLPHQGQGAGQSIEDAAVLSRCLARARPETVPQWLRLYEQIRKPRTEQVQRASRMAGEIYDLTDPEELQRRAPSLLNTRGEWLWNYDADLAFEEGLTVSPPNK